MLKPILHEDINRAQKDYERNWNNNHENNPEFEEFIFSATRLFGQEEMTVDEFLDEHDGDWLGLFQRGETSLDALKIILRDEGHNTA